MPPSPFHTPDTSHGGATRDILAPYRRSAIASTLARELLFSEHVLNEDDQARNVVASAEVWATLAIAEATMTAAKAIEVLAHALSELRYGSR